MSDQSEFSTRRITDSLKLRKSAAPTGFLDAGTTLAKRYLIMDALGSGGMGSVYRARDLRFPNVQKYVAIKVLLNQSPDPRHREMIARNFEREANILASLNHAAIPKIFDFFSEQNRSYLVQEFIDGANLEQIVNRTEGFIPTERVLGWAIDLCEVLAYLHNYKPEPIVFRDMKPANVMIDQHNRVRLIDFGIARGFLIDQKGTVIGTEGYSPPEQYRGLATPAGDIYALGATIHHLLTKRDPRLEAPFSFGDRPIRQINSGVSSEFEAVINRALAYDTNERFPSAAAMREALIRVQHGMSPIPNMPRPGTTGLLPGQSHPRNTGETTRLPAGVASTVSMSSYLDSGGIIPLWSFACEDEIRSTPLIVKDTVYVAAYDNNVYALALDGGKFRWKFAAEGGFSASPAYDDGRILIGSEDGTFYALEADTGKKAWEYVTEGPVHCTAGIAAGVAFFGSDDGNLYAVNTRTGKQVWRYKVGSQVRSRPVINEADSLVYFGSELEEFLAVDFGGQQKWSYRAKRGFTASPLFNEGVVYVGSKDGHLYALDGKNGWPVWRYRSNKPIVSTPAYDPQRDRLFFGSADMNVYAVDSNNGKMVWRFETEGQVASSPALMNDRVYVGSTDGHLYCLDARRGKLEWKFRTNGMVLSSPIVRPEMILIASTDCSIYAITP